MLTEDLHPPPLLVSKVMPLRNFCGGVPNIPVHQLRVPAFVYGVLQGVGLERVAEIFGSDVALGIPVQKRALEEFSVNVVIALKRDDSSGFAFRPLEVVVYSLGKWISQDSVFVLPSLTEFGIVLDGNGAFLQVSVCPAKAYFPELKAADALEQDSWEEDQGVLILPS